MNWEVDLKACTAHLDRCTVHFKPQPADADVDAFCVRDGEGVVWRGRFAPMSIEITNERERMHSLTAAVDAFGKALRKSVDPFPEG